MSDRNPMKGRVLVVDDEKNMGLVIQAMLDRAGFEVICFSEASDAIEAIEGEELDAIVTDLYMPGFGGMEILEHARRHQSQVPVVMITAFGTVESAVNALKHGAFDFITKPFDQSELLEVIDKACRTRRERMKEPDFGAGASLARTSAASDAGVASADRSAPHSDEPFVGASGAPFVGESGAPFVATSARGQELRRVIEKVAGTESPVLISGEDGTGKELVAQAIHRRSPRAERALIKVNCAVIPAALIDNELFGYERGAFSGAVSSKPGRLELAHEATLFLDEVGELPLETQAKLFRTLTDGELERVGGLSTIRVNVRLIAATNQDLATAVREKRFREDLYYRLNVVPVHLPPLRERAEDVDGIVDLFLARFNARLGKRVLRVDPATRAALRAYRWPGNFRQLENAIERMVLLSDSETLTVRDLPEEIAREIDAASGAGGTEAGLGFKETVRRKTQETERALIEQALDEEGGNVTRTAEKLGLSRKGLQLKMKELGIKR
ncbi:MAG: sigma-54-dependent Fis family transcriptional regulator [Bdellovibrionales bacterium]|nr:sigma-54-dependent Fis family transcriptional regulator [Bdellovibrionales bacterium]